MDRIIKYQQKALGLLADKADDFYLAGGTALSKVYFQHRKSYDLDFFTKKFSAQIISNIINLLSESLNLKISLVQEQNKKDMARIAVYHIHIGKREVLKIDFVEDFFEFLKPLKIVDGIAVLSLEDIYLRKVFAITGGLERKDTIGRKILKGGREEAKDFYDLYVLSNTFMRLSEFATRYCDFVRKEGLVNWFRSYDRMKIKTGLVDIVTDKRLDYKDMERHFKQEMDELIKKEMGLA